MVFVAQNSKKETRLDKEDTVILSGIVDNPRITLKELCKRLKTAGVSMSQEGVRKRLDIILKKISLVPLVDWKEFGLELLIVTANVVGGHSAKQKLIRHFKKAGCFICFEAFGAADIIAYFAIKASCEIPRIIDRLKEVEEIKSINYSVVAEQRLFNLNLFRNLS